MTLGQIEGVTASVGSTDAILLTARALMASYRITWPEAWREAREVYARAEQHERNAG